MKRVAFLIAFLFAIPAHGFQVASSFGDGCHERLALDAFLSSSVEFETSRIVVPESESWRKLADTILGPLNLDLSTDVQKFIVVSLILGVRSPDTDGHAILDLQAVRPLHLAPEGQYLHALREIGDDGAAGDEAAVAGIRKQILTSVTENENPLSIITVETNVEYYGRIDVDVLAGAYQVGRALHTLQDSFSHTIRTLDTKRIVHVMNYNEAVGGTLNEKTDGIAHSDSMDRCDGETDPVLNSAKEASIQFMSALARTAPGEDPTSALTEVLDDWVTYETGCNQDNDYCESKWVGVARKEPTGPYLETLLGCGHTAPVNIALPFLLLFGLFWRRSV